MGGDDYDGPPPTKRMKLLPSCEATISDGDIILEDAVMARALPASENETVGSKGQIRRVEFVRIITQALYSLGYEKAAALLEEESGTPLQSPVVSQFRKEILAGKWDESVITLHNIGSLEPGTIKAVTFTILQQKFLEQLCKGETLAALKTLRSEISRLKINTHRVHELASCIVCLNKEDLLEKVGWKGNGPEARFSLLLKLQELLPPHIMIPEKRLEHLVEQALAVQREACVFHNSLNHTLSLYTDHRCGREQIPTQTLQVLEAHENEVWYLQFSHDGKCLASASKDCTAIIWEVIDIDLLKLKHRLTGHQKAVSFVAWSPDDSMILTCGTDEAVKLWDARTGDCKLTFDKPNSGFTSCAWFPDGKSFASGGSDKCIYTWDLNGKELYSFKGPRMPNINDLAITQDGKLMISICANKDIRIYDLKQKTDRVIEEENPITSLSVSDDGRLLLVNLSNQEIHLWDLSSNAKSPLLSKYKGHRQGRYVIRSCFGGSGHAFIVSGSEDSQVYIWHRGNGELLEVLPGHSGTVNCVSWNPVNPHMFASASDDHTIRIWGPRSYGIKEASSSNGGISHMVNGGTRELMEHLKPF